MKKDFKKVFKPKAGELIKACMANNIAKVKKLLARGADIEEKDEDDKTALIISSRSGFTNIVKLLIENGAQVDKKDNGGSTALIWASFGLHADVVQLLIDKDADLEARDKGSGYTALDFAKIYRYKETTDMLEQAPKNREEKRARILAQVTDPALRRPFKVKPPIKFGVR